MSPPRSPLAAKVLEIEDSLQGPPRIAEVTVRAKDWAELVRLASAVEMVEATEAAHVRQHHLDTFSVWLLKKHGLLIDEALMAQFGVKP